MAHNKLFKYILIILAFYITYVTSQDAKYVELKPLDIKNLTEISYMKDEIKLDEDLQKEIDEIKLVNNRTKIAACMVVQRTSLNRGNAQVSQALKDTKHNKEKTFDKIVANQLEHCYSTIPERVIEKVLNPDNLNLWEDSFDEYLKFNKNVFQIIGPEPKLTSSEQYIVDEIQRIIAKPGIEIEVEEEKVDFLTEKLGKYKYMAIGSTIGFTISFLFLVFYYLFIKK